MLNKEVNDIYLVIVGDGVLKDDLMQLARPNKNIIFHPNVINPNEKSFLFKNVEIVSNQSIISPAFGAEGGPLVVLEALSAGTPVLGSNALGNTNRFIVDGINGFVVPHSDLKALHAKMKEILTWKDHERSRRDIILREFKKIPGFENQLRIFHNAAEFVLRVQET